MEFFSKIVDLSNDDKDDEKVPSWMFDDVVVDEIPGWDGTFLTITT